MFSVVYEEVVGKTPCLVQNEAADILPLGQLREQVSAVSNHLVISYMAAAMLQTIIMIFSMKVVLLQSFYVISTLIVLFHGKLKALKSAV